MICAACNSRDAKFCVSRGKNAYIASGIIACGYCYGKDGRRKILRLYWARDIEWMMRNIRMICAACNSRDAKSCVSQANTELILITDASAARIYIMA